MKTVIFQRRVNYSGIFIGS